MNIYISGISGTGMGPLALMAKKVGFNVCGSDLTKGAIFDELIANGIDVFIGEQDATFLAEKIKDGIDWFVYTSALNEEHPELIKAKSAGIKCSKRDDFTAFLVEELGLKMVAVAGTHGKTTTTAMIVWASLKLGLPVSYIVGTTLGFAASGSYRQGDRYFVYEADEYDRNFLKYYPWLSIISAVSYDHPDIYLTEEEYEKAFLQFESQSERVIKKENELESEVKPIDFKLAGEVRREDACLATRAIMKIVNDDTREHGGSLDKLYVKKIVNTMNDFPGVGRRFERIADGIYTDYAHHPEEIVATIDIAKDEARMHDKKGVVVVYQPHQNTRQHEVKDGYKDSFIGVDKVFWLPTYLTRENSELEIIEPSDFIRNLSNSEIAETAELDDELEKRLWEYSDEGYLVVLMAAGPADDWFRNKFSNNF